jgi:7,8-dihydropterin-6-yl-methyl-4-(beta-D-ribofuranosyl)aminobenzene 5'-phosphate synthase
MSALATIALEPVDRVEIRTLVDNTADMLLRSTEDVRRAPLSGAAGNASPMVEAPIFLDGKLPEMLIAEHGFSAMINVTKGQRSHQLMFDAGLSVDGLAHNLHALQISLADVEAIVMSHGHFDHIGGLNGLIKRGGITRLPMLLHPDFWLRRRLAIPGSDAFELPAASRAGIEGAGFEIIEGRRPSLLMDASVLITGEVDRTTEFEKGFPIHQAIRDGEWTPDPLILDDQALIVNVRDRGLVVLTGCGHSGIVNIVRHAQKLTGETRVAAVIGGFHLNGPVFAPLIGPTVDALKAIAPSMIVPGHCTGFEAVQAISLAMPDAFVVNSVGTRYIIGA